MPGPLSLPCLQLSPSLPSAFLGLCDASRSPSPGLAAAPPVSTALQGSVGQGRGGGFSTSLQEVLEVASCFSPLWLSSRSEKPNHIISPWGAHRREGSHGPLATFPPLSTAFRFNKCYVSDALPDHFTCNITLNPPNNHIRNQVPESSKDLAQGHTVAVPAL